MQAGVSHHLLNRQDSALHDAIHQITQVLRAALVGKSGLCGAEANCLLCRGSWPLFVIPFGTAASSVTGCGA